MGYQILVNVDSDSDTDTGNFPKSILILIPGSSVSRFRTDSDSIADPWRSEGDMPGEHKPPKSPKNPQKCQVTTGQGTVAGQKGATSVSPKWNYCVTAE